MIKNLTLFILLIFSLIFTSSFRLTEGTYLKGNTTFQKAKDTLKAEMVQIIKLGNKAVIILNKGRKQGIKVNDTGVIPAAQNTKFTITEVYTFRSKAITDTVYKGFKNTVNIFVDSN